MLKALRAVARFLDERIGWNRVGIALSVTRYERNLFKLHRSFPRRWMG
jgi:hypothetical protein